MRPAASEISQDMETVALEMQGSGDAFKRCLARLELLIEHETDALKICAPLNFVDSNQKKTLFLLEFVRLSRALSPEDFSRVKPHLAQINHKLSENAELLALHLSAMLEVAKIMVMSIQSEESDGTYSGRVASQSRK